MTAASQLEPSERCSSEGRSDAVPSVAEVSGAGVSGAGRRRDCRGKRGLGFGGLVTVLAVGLWALPALGKDEGPEPVPLGRLLSGDALELYTKGKAQFDAGEFLQAHEGFGRAYDLSHQPRLLWNMASASMEAGQRAKAIEELRQFVNLAKGMVPEGRIAQAQEVLADLLRKVVTVTVHLEPPEAQLRVDGRAVSVDQGRAALVLDVGRHDMRSEAPGYEPLEKSFWFSEAAVREEGLKLVKRREARGKVVVESMPGAAIFVDGLAVGMDRWEGALAPGDHEVRVTGSNAEAFQQKFVVVEGDNPRIVARLVPRATAPRWWPWVLGGVAVAGGLGVGAYVVWHRQDVAGEGDPAARRDLTLAPVTLRYGGGF